MPAFDPSDPFPLLEGEAAFPYAEAQRHAAEADRWLGLDAERIEVGIATEARTRMKGGQQRQQLWIGLPVQAMLTPYTEIRAMLARLRLLPGQAIVDLGAGYGRMGLVVDRHHPGVRFVGYEYVLERVREGHRVIHARGDRPLVQLLQADLSDAGFRPSPADAYLIYDYGTRDAIEKTLEDLRAIARERPIAVIGRGRATRDAIERRHPWLSQVNLPEHCGNHSIYRT
jgi:hypothetical protein